MIASNSSPNKLSNNYDQSLSISLKARLHTKLLVSVLVSEKVKSEEMSDMLESTFHMLEILYQDCQQDEPEEKIDTTIKPNEIYLIADPETRQLDILTAKEMSERYKN